MSTARRPGAGVFGAAAAVAWFVWPCDRLSTIVVGTGMMLSLRSGLGW